MEIGAYLGGPVSKAKEASDYGYLWLVMVGTGKKKQSLAC
jgi:hypothetical protein